LTLINSPHTLDITGSLGLKLATLTQEMFLHMRLSPPFLALFPSLPRRPSLVRSSFLTSVFKACGSAIRSGSVLTALSTEVDERNYL